VLAFAVIITELVQPNFYSPSPAAEATLVPGCTPTPVLISAATAVALDCVALGTSFVPIVQRHWQWVPFVFIVVSVVVSIGRQCLCRALLMPAVWVRRGGWVAWPPKTALCRLFLRVDDICLL
jgi:hypothetical protein